MSKTEKNYYSKLAIVIIWVGLSISSWAIIESKKSNPLVNESERAKPITGHTKFYDKDKLLAISQEILAISKKRGSFSVRETELKSVIQAAEKKMRISGISKDLRQVSLVKNILVTLLNEAFNQGFQEFEERFNKTAVLLGLVDDISYIEVNEKHAVVLYMNSGSDLLLLIPMEIYWDPRPMPTFIRWQLGNYPTGLL